MELLTEENIYFNQDIVPPDFAYVTFLRGNASPLSDEQREEDEKESLAEFLASQREAGLLDKCEPDDVVCDEPEMRKAQQVSPFVPNTLQLPVDSWKWEDDKNTCTLGKIETPVVPEMLKTTVEKKKRVYTMKTRKSGGRKTCPTKKERVKKKLPKNTPKEKSVLLKEKEFEPSLEPIVFALSRSDV